MPTGVYKRTKKYKLSKQTRKRQSERMKRVWQTEDMAERNKKIGQYQLGRKHSKETKGKMSKSKLGKKNPAWNGGTSYYPYSIDWNETLRRSIRERDRYVCQLCGKQQGDLAHCVHHIDYNKLNSNPNNLLTICKSCHSRINVNRKHWTNYFQTKLNNS